MYQAQKAVMTFEKCAVVEKNPPLPHGRSSGRGVLKVKILEGVYEAKLEFLRVGWGVQNKIFPMGEYGWFLQLHNGHLECLVYVRIECTVVETHSTSHPFYSFSLQSFCNLSFIWMMVTNIHNILSQEKSWMRTVCLGVCIFSSN